MTALSRVLADTDLIDSIRSNPALADTDQIAQLLTAWARESGSDPAAAAQMAAALIPTQSGAAGPCSPPRPGGTTHVRREDTMPTEPIERVRIMVHPPGPATPDLTRYREWLDSPLTDDPETPDVLAVALLLAGAVALLLAVVAVALVVAS